MDIELSTSTWMFLFFILFLIASVWKIWAFLPNKQLADDDTTKEATASLEKLMLKVIQNKEGKLNEKELFFEMSKNEDFESQLFWRFNLNRLNHLLLSYYAKNPNTSTIVDIYQNIKEQK